MSLLGNLFASDAVKKAAFTGLRKLMEDEKLTCIVLRHNPSNESGIIPGFDVDMFKQPVVVFEENTVGISREQFELFNHLAARKEWIAEQYDAFGRIPLGQLSAWKDPEVQDIINRYLKAKKLQNADHSTESPGDSDTNADAQC